MAIRINKQQTPPSRSQLGTCPEDGHIGSINSRTTVVRFSVRNLPWRWPAGSIENSAYIWWLYGSYYYYGAVLTMWKSSTGMLINPPVVFTLMRQRWSSTTFSLFLVLLMWTSNTYSHLAAQPFFLAATVQYIDLNFWKRIKRMFMEVFYVLVLGIYKKTQSWNFFAKKSQKCIKFLYNCATVENSILCWICPCTVLFSGNC